MKIYATFDEAGFLSGCYPEDVFPPVRSYGTVPPPSADDPDPAAPLLSETRNAAVPAEAVEITAEQWADLLANLGLRKWTGSKIVVFAPPDPPPIVPDSASRLGLMRALRQAGKWDAAKAAIASNADTQEEWDLAISIKRDDPLTAGIIQALGLTSADVDELLIRAAALTS